MSTDVLSGDENYSVLLNACKERNVSLFEFIDLCVPGEDEEMQQPDKLLHLAKLLNRSTTEIARFSQWYSAELKRTAPSELACCEAKSTPLTTGDAGLDALLAGGVYTKQITEVYGESRAGKSTFMLQLALAAQQMPQNRAKSVLYVDTESGLSIERLKQISGRFLEADFEKIVQKRVRSDSEFDAFVCFQLANWLAANPCCLLIIDSVALLGHAERERGRQAKGSVQRLCRTLRALALKYDLAVVAVNQLRSVPGIRLEFDDADDIRYTENQARWYTGWTQKQLFYRQPGQLTSDLERQHQTNAPAIGYEWTSSIDTRLLMKEHGRDRALEVVFSPSAPPRHLVLDLFNGGLRARAASTPPPS